MGVLRACDGRFLYWRFCDSNHCNNDDGEGSLVGVGGRRLCLPRLWIDRLMMARIAKSFT